MEDSDPWSQQSLNIASGAGAGKQALGSVRQLQEKGAPGRRARVGWGAVKAPDQEAVLSAERCSREWRTSSAHCNQARWSRMPRRTVK
ncbi:hypothetical protein GCM10023339_70940 [Alloalcanivorax gelatiniphagus]